MKTKSRQLLKNSIFFGTIQYFFGHNFFWHNSIFFLAQFFLAQFNIFQQSVLLLLIRKLMRFDRTDAFNILIIFVYCPKDS